MNIEKILTTKIKSLENLIKYRDSPQWKPSPDANYDWTHNGGESYHHGKLKALKELKAEIKPN